MRYDLGGDVNLASVRDVADGLRQLVWIDAPDGRRTFANAAWTEFTGLTREQSSGLGWQLALHPTDFPAVAARMEEGAASRAPYAISCRFRSADDEYRLFTGMVFPLRDGGGEIAAWVGICAESDATERADDRFRQLANALPLLVWTTDRDDRLTFANRAWLDYTGLPAGSLIEERNKLVHPDDLGRLIHALRSGADEVEFRLKRRRDGMYRWHLLRWERLGSGDDANFFRVGTAIDIQDRHAAQVERERQMRVIAEAVPDIVWSSDSDGIMDYGNSALSRYIGEPADNMYGERWSAFVHEEDRRPMMDRWRRSLRTGQTFEQKFRLRRHDGVFRWFLARASAIRDASGQVIRWFGTATDIDDQVRSTARLRESERRYRALALENARLYEREHRVSVALQAASLPKEVPDVPWLSMDAVYIPGSADAQIGGDWYDAFRLPDGRIVFSIGDVAGSGLDAAVTMSNMRQIIRGTAQVHADPVLMLNAADRALRLEDPNRFVTAFVAVLSPVTGILAYASAGHVPPFIRRADGSVEILDFCDPPLGLRERHALETAHTELSEGDIVLFYTDGLVEANRDIEAGLATLESVMSEREFANASHPAQFVQHRMLPEGASDDVAVMSVKMGSDAVRAFDLRRWSLPSLTADTLRDIREEFRVALAERGGTVDRIQFAELVLGELAGNVVRHAPGPVEIILDFSNPHPVLHVIDEGPGFARAPMLPQDVMSESGRGLYIVSQSTLEFSVMRRRPKGSHARAVLI